MRHRIKKNKLGRGMSHRKALITNQFRSLVENKKIVTTRAKSRSLKAFAEHYIVYASNKGETLQGKKLLYTVLGSNDLYKKFMKAVKDNQKVKLMRVGFRDGDNSEMVAVMLGTPEIKVKKNLAKQKKARPTQEDKPMSSKKAEHIEEKHVKKNISVKKERSRSRSGI